MEETRLPSIGEFIRGRGTLVAIQEKEPPPVPLPTKDYIFEEITAQYEVRLGDEVLKTSSMYNDFYGKGTSVESTISEAKEYAAERNIGPSSEIEVVVIKTVSQVRTIPAQTKSYYDKQFPEFSALSWGCKYDLPDDVETVVWSSRGNITTQLTSGPQPSPVENQGSVQH